ncbi:hypothetical protein MBLNU13_g01632t1 [Cladosporium sp. NU13]
MPVSDNLFSFGPPELKSSVLQPLSSSQSPKSSLYLAVRIRSLVNALRKRVDRRSQTARKRADDASFCRDIEREAYLEIDRYLGRKSRHNNAGKVREGVKKVVAVQDGVARIDRAPSRERPNASRSLRNIEYVAGLKARTLITLATNNKDFLLRRADFSVKRLNIKELQQLILDVKDLLDTPTLTLDSSACTHPFTYASKQLLDLTHIANLHHLLLCLLSQLLCQLIHLCIELVRDHIAECQKLRRRWREEWFFEFPDGRPPLSTTWPWAIKPSLAVLWGVCWMFFWPFFWDTEGNLLNLQGNIQVSRRELDQWRLSDQASMNNSASQQHLPQHSVANTYNNIPDQMSSAGSVLYRHSAAYPPAHLSAPAYRPIPLLPANATMVTQPQTRRPLDTRVTQPRQSQSSSRVQHAFVEHNQAPASYPGLAQQAGTNTAYPAPPAAAHAGPVAEASWLPQDANFHLPYLEQQDTWRWQEQNHTSQGPRQYPQQPAHTRGNVNLAVQTQSLPPRPRSTSQALTPTIRVTTERPYTPESQAQPQDSHHTSATSLHAPYTYANAPYIDHNAQFYPDASFGTMSTEVQIQGPPPQVGQVGQMAPQGGIASPISDNPALSRPISPSNVPMDPNVRKRSFSEMSQQQPPPPPPQMHMMPTEHQSPQPSAYETSPGGMEESGHKVQRMIKRGDPPQAHDGKYYCNFSTECADQYFDRKCEWSKHMDKHDRPYRCPQPQCAKLQGFTYSGGLLRHEREVHGKHGGPKEQLRCTVPECKRHAGKGFTRKENLNEHLRRVHGITTTSDASQLRQIAVDAAPGAEMMETPASRFSDTADVDDFTTATTAYPDLANPKRRRLDMGASPRSSTDDLELELQRLKADNLEKDERIRRMEENDAAREARMKSLEDRLAQLTPQTLQQRIPEQANMGTYPDFNGSAAEVVMQQVHGPEP